MPAPIAALLLDWYDKNARALPWRAPPGSTLPPDPYRVWLSEVMLQQTTVAAVKAYFRRFTTLWPTVDSLAAAPDAAVMAEWAGLGYYARARNLLKCARKIAARGAFPTTRDALQTLPGIGPYTAAAIAAIAFNQPATVVDGNVERVISRLFAVTAPLPKSKPELTRLAATLTPFNRPGDFAQAMMDLGATICAPRNPACALCPLTAQCQARALGLEGQLPAKTSKPAKPTRQGAVWVAYQPDGAILLEDRPPKGLLGGMPGLPGNGWDGHGGPEPLDLAWQRVAEVRHTFTHFHLVLQVMAAPAPPGANPLRGSFRHTAATGLPTLMKKAVQAAQAVRKAP